MEWMKYVLLFLLFITIYLNLIASISLYRASTLESFQKFAQFVIVWIFTIFGAWFVIHMLSEQEVESIPRRWMPQRFQGWLIIAGTYHEQLHGRNSDSMNDHISHSGGDGGGGD